MQTQTTDRSTVTVAGRDTSETGRRKSLRKSLPLALVSQSNNASRRSLRSLPPRCSTCLLAHPSQSHGWRWTLNDRTHDFDCFTPQPLTRQSGHLDSSQQLELCGCTRGEPIRGTSPAPFSTINSPPPALYAWLSAFSILSCSSQKESGARLEEVRSFALFHIFVCFRFRICSPPRALHPAKQYLSICHSLSLLPPLEPCLYGKLGALEPPSLYR